MIGSTGSVRGGVSSMSSSGCVGTVKVGDTAGMGTARVGDMAGVDTAGVSVRG